MATFPFSASPQIVQSPSCSRYERIERRIAGASSTTRILTVTAASRCQLTESHKLHNTPDAVRPRCAEDSTTVRRKCVDRENLFLQDFMMPGTGGTGLCPYSGRHSLNPCFF